MLAYSDVYVFNFNNFVFYAPREYPIMTQTQFGQQLDFCSAACEQQLLSSMFADDGGEIADVEIIQSDLLKTAEEEKYAGKRAARIGMAQKPQENWHIRFASNPSSTILFSNQHGTHVPLSQAIVIKDRGVIVQNKFSPRAQTDVVIAKVRNMLAFM